MVICNSHNFIFLRIPKNASTSLASFFIKNCCNHAQDKWTGGGDASISPDSVIKKYRHQYRFIHLTLQELVDENLISEQNALRRTAIGIIRNPFERQLSLFFFKNRRNNRSTPEQFRKEFKQGYHESDGSNHILQTEYLMLNGRQHGEFWKYENIPVHLDDFVERMNINTKYPLRTYKSQFRARVNKSDDIDLFYDKETKRAVEKYYARDFEVYESL